MLYFQHRRRSINCFYGLTSRKTWSCSLKDDKHHQCSVWGQMYQKCTCLFVHLEVSPLNVQRWQSSFHWSCPRSRLPKLQRIWVIVQQGQGPSAGAWSQRGSCLVHWRYTHTCAYAPSQRRGDELRGGEQGADDTLIPPSLIRSGLQFTDLNNHPITIHQSHVY